MKTNPVDIQSTSAGVAPDNAYECARADMIVDSVKDMEDKMAMLFWEKDEQRKVMNVVL